MRLRAALALAIALVAGASTAGCGRVVNKDSGVVLGVIVATVNGETIDAAVAGPYASIDECMKQLGDGSNYHNPPPGLDIAYGCVGSLSHLQPK